MSIKIGHASIDERGKISGGSAGDQTQKEVCIRNWYNKPWNVMLICNDKELALRASEYMKAICRNDDFGYDQNQRTTGYLAIVNAKGDVSKATPSEFDCSSLVASCYKLAGLNISVSLTTRNMKNALLKTGKFVAYTDSQHIASDYYAEPGAIYLKEGSHVVMALEYGIMANKEESKQTQESTEKPEVVTAPTYTVGKNYTLQVELKVRTDAGILSKIKSHLQLTASGRKHDKDKDGALDKGTVITCQKIKKVGNDIWIKCPSGWVAGYYSGKIYIK